MAPGCFPIFDSNHGSSAAEVFKYFWWEPAEPAEQVLRNLANRTAGSEAGPHLRAAWKHASEAIEWSPEQPPYYMGPYYLGAGSPDVRFPFRTAARRFLWPIPVPG